MELAAFGTPRAVFVGHSRKREKNKIKRREQMVKLAISTSEPMEVYRAGTYLAELREVKDAGTNPFDETRQQFKLAWQLFDQNAQEVGQLSYWVNQSAHEKSTLMAIASALYRAEIADIVAQAQDLDTDELIGERCMLVLTKEKNQKGNDVNRVKAYLPLDEPSEAPAPLQPVPPRPAPASRPPSRFAPAGARQADDLSKVPF